MANPNKMIDPQKMMDLIIQSVGKSDLFRDELEKEFVKIVLEMALVKGDFVHFVEYYGCRVDRSDFEIYFKDWFVKNFGEDSYELFVSEYYGDLKNEL